MASVKAAGAVAGWSVAGVVVATATPEAEAVLEIARELGVSVEEARILYRAVLFGAAVGVGFGMFISWLLAALLWRLLEPRSAAASTPRHAETFWPLPSSSPSKQSQKTSR